MERGLQTEHNNITT